MNRVFSILLLLALAFGGRSQNFQTIFPGLSGPVLIDSVAAHFRPDTVLDYANARDTLYAKVLAVDDDSLRCIYSGHTLYMDPTQDPTQYVYQNGGANGMNAEHAYPQAKGAMAGTNAHSDMHHLYPTRIAVNEARGDKPYVEIPDAQTQKWFINNQVFTSTPTQHIELYAESTAAAFEPRESVKGDLARSIFYFYTVYRSQANAADPNFFESQRHTLCLWNAQDPADDNEWVKTWRIAAYQDGKPNPFVVDCSLARRCWCPEVANNCITGVSTPALPQELSARIAPLPAGAEAQVYGTAPFAGVVSLRFLSPLGIEVWKSSGEETEEGAFSIPLPVDRITAKGLHSGFLEIIIEKEGKKASKTLPLLLLN